MEGIPSRLQNERPHNIFNSKPGRPRLPSRTGNLSMLIYHHLPMLCMLHILKQLPGRPSPWTWGFTARNHKYQCLAWSSRCRDAIAMQHQEPSKSNQIKPRHILGVSENSLYTCMYLCMYMIYIYIYHTQHNKQCSRSWMVPSIFLPCHGMFASCRCVSLVMVLNASAAPMTCRRSVSVLGDVWGLWRSKYSSIYTPQEGPRNGGTPKWMVYNAKYH